MTYVGSDGLIEPPPDDRIPALLLTSPPEDIESLAGYSARISELSGRFGVRGVVLIATHWIEPGTSRNVLLDVTGGVPVELRKPQEENYQLAERIAKLLAQRGIICDIDDRGTQRPNADSLPELFEAAASRPIVRVSVPLNYGPDLMVVTGVALAPLRDERVLVAAKSDRMGPRLRERVASRDFAAVKRYANSAPQSRTAHVFPLLFVMGASTSSDRLYPVRDSASSPIMAFGVQRQESARTEAVADAMLVQS